MCVDFIFRTALIWRLVFEFVFLLGGIVDWFGELGQWDLNQSLSYLCGDSVIAIKQKLLFMRDQLLIGS